MTDGDVIRFTFGRRTRHDPAVASVAPPPSATDATRAAPGIDVAPPVTPNLVAHPRVPGRGRIGQNIVETLIFRGLASPVALVLVVLQSRFLHPEGRGAFVLVVLSVTIFSRLLGQLGIAVTNRAQDSETELRPLTQRALALGFLFSLPAAAVVFAWGAATPEIGGASAMLGALALIPNVLWQTISGVLLGEARIRLWNVIQSLPQAITLLGMAGLVARGSGGLSAAVAVWLAGQAATAVFALVAARTLWLPLGPSPVFDPESRTLLRLAFAMGGVQVLNLVSYRIELFLLVLFGSVRDAGIYSISVQTSETAWLISAAIASSITGPAVHEDPGPAVRLTANAAVRGLLLTTIPAAALAAGGPFYIPALYGHAFSGAALPLALLLPGTLLYAPVSILVVYISVRRGRPRLSLAVSLIGMAVTTVAALALIPPFGPSGAALASAIGYAAGAAAAWVGFAQLARRPI